MTVESCPTIAPNQPGQWYPRSGQWRRRGVSETISPRLATVSRIRPREPDPSPKSLTEQPWINDVSARLREFMALGENWNGYGEQPINTNAVIRTAIVLHEIGRGGPGPVVVPVYDGGIQIEWYSDDTEIEVLVPPSEPMEVCLKQPDGTMREIRGLRDFSHPIWSRLRTTIRNFTDTSRA